MNVARTRPLQREARRQAILDAARQAFLERGYAAATIDSIAAKVKISPALIYRHFDGKPALFAAIVEEGLERLHDALESTVRPEQPGIASLRAIAAAYLAFYREQREYFNVLNFYDHVHGQTPFPPPHRDAIQQKVNACLQVVAGVLQAGQETGAFRQHDAWQTANAFWGAFNGILLLEAHGKTRLAQTELEPLLDVLLDMVERTITAD